MKGTSVVAFFLTLFLASGSALGFVDQFAYSPQAPTADSPITISFRTGACEAVVTPEVWQLVGTGNLRDLVVDGLYALDPLSCIHLPYTSSIVIGTLPPGNYTIHIKIRDPFDGIGIPSPSFGSVQFSVGEARTIPSLNSYGMIFLGLAFCVVALKQQQGLADA